MTDSILLASIHRLETQICEAAAKLPPSPPDVLEQIAARLNEAMSDPRAAELPKEATAKGRALIAMFAATAEFQRAVAKYAEATLLQIVAEEKAK